MGSGGGFPPGCAISHHGVEDGEEFSGESDEGIAADAPGWWYAVGSPVALERAGVAPPRPQLNAGR